MDMAKTFYIYYNHLFHVYLLYAWFLVACVIKAWQLGIALNMCLCICDGDKVSFYVAFCALAYGHFSLQLKTT